MTRSTSAPDLWIVLATDRRSPGARMLYLAEKAALANPEARRLAPPITFDSAALAEEYAAKLVGLGALDSRYFYSAARVAELSPRLRSLVAMADRAAAVAGAAVSTDGSHS